MELRCSSSILHGVIEDGVLEVLCKSNRCGKESGVVVLHRFNVETGKLIETKKYKDPTRKGKSDASGHCVSIRSA